MLSTTDAARTVTMTARLMGDGISGMLLLKSSWDAWRISFTPMKARISARPLLR